MLNQKPSPQKGIKRVWSAIFYSVDGLRFAFSNEAAFRQELFFVAISIIALLVLPISFVCKCVLLFATTSIIVVEIINSGIEAVVDMVSPEYSDLAKHAKNLGSAAVFLSISIAVVLWCMTIYYFFL